MDQNIKKISSMQISLNCNVEIERNNYLSFYHLKRIIMYVFILCIYLGMFTQRMNRAILLNIDLGRDRYRMYLF